jgi:dTDP-glucose 4,6-dehydratase
MAEESQLSWSGKRVLVTGAGGFIGSHLAERLVQQGAQTRALVRYVSTGSRGFLDDSLLANEMQIIAGDIRDAELIARACDGVDVVFHLAALIAIPYSYEAPSSYVQVNIQGTLNVLEAARRAGVGRVVQTSTSEVYGTARTVPIDESHPLQGQSPYSASKIGADKLAESFFCSFQTPVTIVRPFNTFGPRQSARAVIPTIITQALTQPEVRLGSLEPTRDLNYVDDTVSGFLQCAAADRAVGQVINLGSGREISIGDLARLILGMIGRDVPIVCESQRQRPAGSEVERLLASAARARDIAGWSPRFTLEQGLERTIAWIRQHPEVYRVGGYRV